MAPTLTSRNPRIGYPSFWVEALGLAHLFLFADEGTADLRSLPFAVEAAWVSPDCTSRLLFIHAVVPNVHRERIAAWLDRIGNCRYAWAGTGWEYAAVFGAEPLPTTWVPACTPNALEECPLAVAVVFETWGRRRSLDGIWRTIQQRLGGRVREYVGRRYYATNGKAHVRFALQTLAEHGAFRQYVVRYRPLLKDTVQLLVLGSWTEPELRTLLADIAHDTVMSVAYPTTAGWLLQLAGRPRLIERVMDARADAVYFLREEVPARFRYEDLFVPSTKSWRYPDRKLPTPPARPVRSP